MILLQVQTTNAFDPWDYLANIYSFKGKIYIKKKEGPVSGVNFLYLGQLAMISYDRLPYNHCGTFIRLVKHLHDPEKYHDAY